MTVDALVLAGGRGDRMAAGRPEPKPLVPYRGRPLIEHVLERVIAAGCVEIHVALGHRAGEVAAHLRRWPVHVLTETVPLGTIGAVGLLRDVRGPLLVLNADVLCTLDLEDLVAFHRTHSADLTIATHEEVLASRFGVVESDSAGRVVAYHEKPSHRWWISSGHYILGERSRALIGPGESLGFDALARRCIAAGLAVVERRHDGSWLDVNDPGDLTRAEEAAAW
jgi:NDP-sugar pyrophosphorylase family protein